MKNHLVGLLCAMVLSALGGCGSSTEGSALPVDAAADAGGDAGPVPDTDAPPATALVYVAHRGVSTPWFVPVDGSGAGPAVQLGPRRGAGYGLGEGDVSYPLVTPDGATVVVAFYPLATPSSSASFGAVLFALPVTGAGATAPVRVASAADLHVLDRDARDGWLAYVDGRRLYAARLDGSNAGAEVPVAEVAEGQEIRSPRFVVGTSYVAYQRGTWSGGAAEVVVSEVPGAGAPGAVVQTTAGPAELLAGELEGGRLVVRGPDDRLYAVDIDGTKEPVVLTPEGVIADFVGATADGSRIVAELRTTWAEDRELISAAADGSDATAPKKLTPKPAQGLSPLMSRDGAAVAWTTKNEVGQWAVFVAPSSGLTPSQDPRVSSWSAQRLYVTAFDAAAGALVGARDDGAVLALATAGEPVAPKVLALVSDVVNLSIPWPVLTVDGQRVLYDANTATGWHAWTVPVKGGEATELPDAWYRDLITPFGLLHHEYVEEGAVFKAGLTPGSPTPLTDWHDSAIVDARLVPGGGHVVYAASSPAPGWYAASTTPPGPPGRTLVMDAPAAATPSSGWSPDRPLETKTHLVRINGGKVESAALDGSNVGAPLILAGEATSPFVIDSEGGRALFVGASGVAAARVDGSEPPVLLLKTAGPVRQIALLPDSQRALVAIGGDTGATIYAAPLDGSGADAPVLVAQDLPGWLIGMAPTAGGAYVYTVHSVEATAVPHPDVLLAARTDGATGGAAYPLAPAGYTLWSGGPVSSPNGLNALLGGPAGLYSARSDGSEAAAPRHLGSATETIGPPFSPDGTHLLLREGGSAVVVTLGQSDSQVGLTTAADGGAVRGEWTISGDRVVLLLSDAKGFDLSGALALVETIEPPSPPQRLHPAEFRGTHLHSLTPDGEAAVVESQYGMDRSLYLVPLASGQAHALPKPTTPIDDAGETFVGFVK